MTALISYLELALAPGVIASIALAFAMVLVWIQQRRDSGRMRQALRERDAMLECQAGELRAILDCSRGMAQRVQRLDQRISDLARKVDLLDAPRATDGNAARALQLLRQGYSVADIAAIRELSPSETELLSALADFKEVA